MRWLLLSMLVGCAINLDNAKRALSPRASQELSCPQSKLDFEEVKQTLSPSFVKVVGCGKAQHYQLVEGQWRPAPAPLPPPAY